MGIFDFFKKKPKLSKEQEALDAQADELIPELETFYKKNTAFFGHAKVQEVLVQMRDSNDPEEKLELLEQAYKMVSDVVYSLTDRHYHEARRKMLHDQKIAPFRETYAKIKKIYEQEASLDPAH